MSKKNYITLKGDIEAVTDKAIRFFDEDGWEGWIPRSVCEDGDDIEEMGNADLCVEEWWWDKRDD